MKSDQQIAPAFRISPKRNGANMPIHTNRTLIIARLLSKWLKKWQLA
jgi:hypothetical protein